MCCMLLCVLCTRAVRHCSTNSHLHLQLLGWVNEVLETDYIKITELCDGQ